MALPQRKRLPHVAPDFVPCGSLFFLTLCGDPRGQNQFALSGQWEAIQNAGAHYHAALRWRVRLLLAMPDHLHLAEVLQTMKE